jgi:formamidopyrimidine-DNA glycosylase
MALGSRVAVKTFLMDQRRIAGLGNIYASEVLHRAGLDPRRRAGALAEREWGAVAAEIRAVLAEAIAAMGTTFSSYRTVWGEPGQYGESLRVYDRANEPCQRCGTPIRRIVQGQRSTFYCPSCQGGRPGPRGTRIPREPCSRKAR